MPRSNSSFGVADGGRVVSAGARAGSSCRRRQGAGRIARPAGVGEIERLPCPAAAGSADRALRGNRQLAAAERLRRARGIGILAGIEGIATAPAWRRRHALRGLLHDRRRRGNLRTRLHSRLDLGLPDRRRTRLRCGRGGDIGLGAAGGPPGAACAPPCSALSRSSSCRLRYCSSSFWPVSWRSRFSSCWIRISASGSSDCCAKAAGQ